MQILQPLTKAISVFLSALLLASCATTTRTTSTATSKEMDIYGPGVIQYPVVAEKEVDSQKVTGEATGSKEEDVENLKRNAVVNTLKNNEADVLIEPVFETMTDEEETRVIVTGFPGRYVNFRPATADDVRLLEVGQLQQARTYEARDEEVERPEAADEVGALLFLGGVAVALLLVLVAQ